MLQHRFFPAIGGSEKHVYLLGKYLTMRGHDVTVYTTTSLSNRDVPSLPFLRREEEKVSLPQRETLDGITVERFNIALRYWSFNWIPELSKRLRRNIKQFDIIHAHGYHISTSLIGCYYARKYGKPFVLTAHDLIIPDNLSVDARVFKRIYDKTIGRYLLRNSKRLIALTDDHIHQYSERGGDVSKIRIIPNGIEVEKYLNKKVSRRVIEKYDLDDSDKVLLFVGRIEKYKGIQDVIEILPSILKIYPSLKFVVVGRDYGFKEELERLVEDLNLGNNVVFTGGVSEDELLDLYKLADIFILPSKMEGFGIVLLEAMASNTLCIAYSIPAVRKVIVDKENGILVENKEELLRSILYYLDNKGEKNRIEKNALQYVRNYDASNVTRLLERVYEEVIQ